MALLSAELAVLREQPDDTAVIGPVTDSPTWPEDTADDPESVDAALSHTHVRADRWARWWPDELSESEPVPEPLPDPVRLAIPGRHAARRPQPSVAGAIGSAIRPPLGNWAGLRDRVAVAPVHLSLVAVLVAVVLGGSCWWLLQGQGSGTAAPITPVEASIVATPSRPDPDSTPTPPPNDQTGASLPTPAPASPGEVIVDVSGRVRHPGVQVLVSGARVVDAIKAAGGARARVDLSSVNLARTLVDGEQIVVGAPGQAGAAPGSSPGGPSGSGALTPGALVNLNTADEATLDTLPGVGPVTANAILGYRSEHGGFGSVDELIDVDGIGEATLSRLRPLVTI